VTYADPLGLGGPYERGAIVGNVYSLPDHVNIAGGYETFEFLGPQAVPEPASALLLLAAPLLLRSRWRKNA
jgi:hypothetical protein